jgi:ABC-type transport system involved in cytochrome c biogenesis ATPase subunit
VAGVNEVLRQQGLLPTAQCLASTERLSPGQGEKIAIARQRHSWLLDEQFIADHAAEW